MARLVIGPLKGALFVTLGIGLLFAYAARPAAAAHTPYVVGDVFAGDSNGLIYRYSPTGVLLDTLDTTSNAQSETGMCFSQNGDLRSTNFDDNTMTLFDNAGNVITYPWGSGFNAFPESCVLNAAGDVYVGQAEGSGDVLKFNQSGALEASFDVQLGNKGSDWIDLAADQCTLYYTSEGNTIYRYDVCRNTQLANFATNFTDPGSSTDCFALRIRPNGDVLVACSDKVYRLNAAGVVIQRYPAPAGSTLLFALNLDPDNTSFWTADLGSGMIYRYDINTGLVLTQFQGPTTGVSGLAVFGEITVGAGGGAPTPTPTAASLDLEPKAATSTVGTQQCVTATVRDATAQPLQGVTVVFSVTGTAGNSAGASVVTNANGQAPFCYSGPTTPGVDTIHAYADTNTNRVQDVGEAFGDATKEWVPGPPKTLDLEPKTATNPVDTQHCPTATVRDASGNPVKGVVVRFSVSGSVNTSGSATTNKAGQATFCYTGPPLPGADAIKAYADTNGNGVQDVGEPFDAATKAWVLPVSTPLCEVKFTVGGWIIANNGDRGNFGGNASTDGNGNASGVQEYQDHGPAAPYPVGNFDLHGNVLAIVCDPDGRTAHIFGDATINGSGSHTFRIDVTDNGEPGCNDHYRIRVDTYDSGDHMLMGGNIQVHKSS